VVPKFCQRNAEFESASICIRGLSRNTRTDIPALPKCQYRLCALKPSPFVPVRRPYPISPVTLGDFLYKKRHDLNLTQKQVALDILQTSIANVRGWESNRHEISLDFRPRITEFIGYCPCDVSLSLGQRLKERRENFGFSIRKLSRILEVDQSTVAYWERNEHKPSKKSRRIIGGFLKSYSPEKCLVEKAHYFNYELLLTSPVPKYVEYDMRWSVRYKIIAWRTSVGLSQRNLARLVGVCLQSIVRWEKGQRTPKPKYLKLILRAIISYSEQFYNSLHYEH
jgi:DNA-binding transcriptional regulator YiaG